MSSWSSLLLLAYFVPLVASDATVIVVGAGYAGLTAARCLHRHGVNVTVLEAASHVGGRAYDFVTPENKLITESGVEFLGTAEQSPHAYQLFKEEYGLSIYPSGAYVANSTQKLVCRDFQGQLLRLGGPLLITELFKCVSPGAALQAAAVIAELEVLVSDLNASAPWLHPKAHELDSISWEAFMRQRLGPEALQFINRGYAPGLSDAPERVSMLHALFLAKTGGGLIEGLTGFNNGYRVKEGGAAAAKRMAQELGPRLHLNTPVSLVTHQPGSRLVVRTVAGQDLSADYVIMTGSPTGLRKIEFLPQLPHDTRRLFESIHQGNSVRVSVIYPEPWWRSAGLSGSIGDLLDNSYIYYAFDSSPADSSVGVLQFHLCGWGGDALMQMSPSDREEYLVTYLVKFLGPQAANYSHILGHDFGQDAYIGGGFQANFPPGSWFSYGNRLFNNPANDTRIHFAGTEWTPIGFGYVDGAIASGSSAAETIILKLGHET